MNEREDLQRHVDSIANDLTNPTTYEDACIDHEKWDSKPCDQVCSYAYINDAMDIEYTISSHGQFLGARVLVCFGGPNIWVDTRHNRVEGYSWGDSAFAEFTDCMDLHEACEELYKSRG